MLAKFYAKLWSEAYESNDTNIKLLLENKKDAKLLDIGCGDGVKTLKYAGKIGTKNVTGIDGQKDRLKAATERGIETKYCNLEKKWPLKSNQFDVVVTNQVIEHISDVDHFISESKRVLKPDGYVVVSTENLSSWHNIFALIIGFQDFSHHLINKLHVGNPISPHFGEKTVSWSAKDNSGIDDTAFPHLKIFTYRSLRKVFEVYDFNFVKGLASGYYPLWGVLSSLFSKIDPYHSHFICIKFRKNSLP